LRHRRPARICRHWDLGEEASRGLVVRVQLRLKVVPVGDRPPEREVRWALPDRIAVPAAPAGMRHAGAWGRGGLRAGAQGRGREVAEYRESRGTYGAPRVHAELAAQGIHVGRKRVVRLMRAAHVQGVSRRKWVTTTTRDPEVRSAPDRVQRDFHVDGPDRLWVADITYVPTGVDFLYLAVVLDAWSRRVIGWAMETHLRTELVLAALDMALRQRRPNGVRA